MKQLFATLICTCCFVASPTAQTNKMIPGDYLVHSVRETATGFSIKQDSSFEFFFSYGALDRYGTGKWTVKDDKIIFNSQPWPGNDFKLTESKKTTTDFITLQIEDKQPALYSFVYAIIKTAAGDSAIRADSDGLIALPKNIDSLHLLFEFSAERTSSYAIDIKANNYFTFQLQPWIVEVFFKDFELRLVTDHLEGMHPLLEPGENYSYIKE